MNPQSVREMPFVEHLAELRVRLLWSLGAIACASVLSYSMSEKVFLFLTSPFVQSFPEARLIGIGPAEAFLVKLKVALAAGLIISLPIVFYQLWAFVAPGLHSEEKRHAIPFVAFSTLFFLVGAGFCFYLVLPLALRFFSSEFLSIGVDPTIRIGDYLSFTLRLVLVFGLVFEMPVVSYFLTAVGFLSHQWLIRQGRLAIVAIFIVAGILTPPDVITQLLLAGPLLVLYGLCIGISYAVRS